MNKFAYLAPARIELRNAAFYYRERSSRVAASFLAAVQAAVDQVLEFPESAPFVRGEVRGKTVSKFPYTMMYRVDGDTVVILAVAHQKQRPQYWVGRVSP